MSHKSLAQRKFEIKNDKLLQDLIKNQFKAKYAASKEFERKSKLLGDFIANALDSNPNMYPGLMKDFKEVVKKASDRALFGFDADVTEKSEETPPKKQENGKPTAEKLKSKEVKPTANDTIVKIEQKSISNIEAEDFEITCPY